MAYSAMVFPLLISVTEVMIADLSPVVVIDTEGCVKIHILRQNIGAIQGLLDCLVLRVIRLGFIEIWNRWELPRCVYDIVNSALETPGGQSVQHHLRHSLLPFKRFAGCLPTDQGREFVREAQRVGMLVDVSHISDEGFWDIMKITEAPIIATHSNSRALCQHPRNLTDDMFRAIVETGGVAGYNLCAAFNGDNPDLDTACDHMFHFLSLDHTGTHVALGGDLDGITNMPRGFAGVQSWPALAQRLSERGLDEHTIQNIFWSNAIGVMDRAVCNHKK